MRMIALWRNPGSSRSVYTISGIRGPHALRIATLAALLGHSRLVMAQRYVHPGESHRIEAVESSKSSMRCAEEAEKRQAQEEWAHKWAQCQKSRKF